MDVLHRDLIPVRNGGVSEVGPFLEWGDPGDLHPLLRHGILYPLRVFGDGPVG